MRLTPLKPIVKGTPNDILNATQCLISFALRNNNNNAAAKYDFIKVKPSQHHMAFTGRRSTSLHGVNGNNNNNNNNNNKTCASFHTKQKQNHITTSPRATSGFLSQHPNKSQYRALSIKNRKTASSTIEDLKNTAPRPIQQQIPQPAAGNATSTQNITSANASQSASVTTATNAKNINTTINNVADVDNKQSQQQFLHRVLPAFALKYPTISTTVVGVLLVTILYSVYRINSVYKVYLKTIPYHCLPQPPINVEQITFDIPLLIDPNSSNNKNANNIKNKTGENNKNNHENKIPITPSTTQLILNTMNNMKQYIHHELTTITNIALQNINLFEKAVGITQHLSYRVLQLMESISRLELLYTHYLQYKKLLALQRDLYETNNVTNVVHELPDMLALREMERAFDVVEPLLIDNTPDDILGGTIAPTYPQKENFQNEDEYQIAIEQYKIDYEIYIQRSQQQRDAKRELVRSARPMGIPLVGFTWRYGFDNIDELDTAGILNAYMTHTVLNTPYIQEEMDLYLLPYLKILYPNIFSDEKMMNQQQQETISSPKHNNQIPNHQLTTDEQKQQQREQEKEEQLLKLYHKQLQYYNYRNLLLTPNADVDLWKEIEAIIDYIIDNPDGNIVKEQVQPAKSASRNLLGKINTVGKVKSQYDIAMGNEDKYRPLLKPEYIEMLVNDPSIKSGVFPSPTSTPDERKQYKEKIALLLDMHKTFVNLQLIRDRTKPSVILHDDIKKDIEEEYKKASSLTIDSSKDHYYFEAPKLTDTRNRFFTIATDSTLLQLMEPILTSRICDDRSQIILSNVTNDNLVKNLSDIDKKYDSVGIDTSHTSTDNPYELYSYSPLLTLFMLPQKEYCEMENFILKNHFIDLYSHLLDENTSNHTNHTDNIQGGNEKPCIPPFKLLSHRINKLGSIKLFDIHKAIHHNQHSNRKLLYKSHQLTPIDHYMKYYFKSYHTPQYHQYQDYIKNKNTTQYEEDQQSRNSTEYYDNTNNNQHQQADDITYAKENYLLKYMAIQTTPVPFQLPILANLVPNILEHKPLFPLSSNNDKVRKQQQQKQPEICIPPPQLEYKIFPRYIVGLQKLQIVLYNLQLELQHAIAYNQNIIDTATEVQDELKLNELEHEFVDIENAIKQIETTPTQQQQDHQNSKDINPYICPASFIYSKYNDLVNSVIGLKTTRFNLESNTIFLQQDAHEMFDFFNYPLLTIDKSNTTTDDANTHTSNNEDNVIISIGGVVVNKPNLNDNIAKYDNLLNNLDDDYNEMFIDQYPSETPRQTLYDKYGLQLQNLDTALRITNHNKTEKTKSCIDIEEMSYFMKSFEVSIIQRVYEPFAKTLEETNAALKSAVNTHKTLAFADIQKCGVGFNYYSNLGWDLGGNRPPTVAQEEQQQPVIPYDDEQQQLVVEAIDRRESYFKQWYGKNYNTLSAPSFDFYLLPTLWAMFDRTSEMIQFMEQWAEVNNALFFHELDLEGEGRFHMEATISRNMAPRYRAYLATLEDSDERLRELEEAEKRFENEHKIELQQFAEKRQKRLQAAYSMSSESRFRRLLTNRVNMQHLFHELDVLVSGKNNNKNTNNVNGINTNNNNMDTLPSLKIPMMLNQQVYLQKQLANNNINNNENTNTNNNNNNNNNNNTTIINITQRYLQQKQAIEKILTTTNNKQHKHNNDIITKPKPTTIEQYKTLFNDLQRISHNMTLDQDINNPNNNKPRDKQQLYYTRLGGTVPSKAFTYLCDPIRGLKPYYSCFTDGSQSKQHYINNMSEYYYSYSHHLNDNQIVETQQQIIPSTTTTTKNMNDNDIMMMKLLHRPYYMELTTDQMYNTLLINNNNTNSQLSSSSSSLPSTSTLNITSRSLPCSSPDEIIKDYTDIVLKTTTTTMLNQSTSTTPVYHNHNIETYQQDYQHYKSLPQQKQQQHNQQQQFNIVNIPTLIKSLDDMKSKFNTTIHTNDKKKSAKSQTNNSHYYKTILNKAISSFKQQPQQQQLFDYSIQSNIFSKPTRNSQSLSLAYWLYYLRGPQYQHYLFNEYNKYKKKNVFDVRNNMYSTNNNNNNNNQVVAVLLDDDESNIDNEDNTNNNSDDATDSTLSSSSSILSKLFNVVTLRWW